MSPKKVGVCGETCAEKKSDNILGNRMTKSTVMVQKYSEINILEELFANGTSQYGFILSVLIIRLFNLCI